jgi:5-methylcytosine-specific restriction endonuclease McrA
VFIKILNSLKKHTKIYFDYFGYGIDSVILCEVCGAKAVDLHHIFRRGMGGSKSADTIENIMALCRYCHTVMGDTKTHMEYLKNKHKEKLDGKG